MSAATFIGVLSPAVVLLLLGFDPGWAAGVMVAGFVSIWWMTIVLARRSVLKEQSKSGQEVCPHCGRPSEQEGRSET
jgi:Mg/Co/Ni transporter MgtE